MDKKVKTEEIMESEISENLKTGVMPKMSEDLKTSAMPSMSDSIKTSAMPSMSDSIKTSAMPSMSENIKTSAMPSMSDSIKTSAMPSMSDSIKTSAMPSMSENIKTSAMPGMSESTKTDALPGMTGYAKTDALPGMTGYAKTDALPEIAENSETRALPNIEGNGRNDFENGVAQENLKKFYGNKDNNVGTEKIIVNDRGDRHYRTIGDYFNEGGEAGLCHIECNETNKRYVAKIYFNTRRYNTHIDDFIDDVKPNGKDGLMEICDRGFVEVQGNKQNRAYILPDYYGTKNLFEYLKNHVLSEQEIIELIKNISESLNKMHMKGYYHRDIKPDNILYDDDLERPIIIDYGIVTSANLVINDVAVTDTAKGTQGYLPPEFDTSVGVSVNSGDGKIEVEASSTYDFFQLGVVICDIYCSIYAGMGTAKRMFMSNRETSNSCQYAKFKFPPNLEKNQRMVNLVKALLRCNSVERAGYKEVMAWLDGAVLEVDRPTEKDKKARYMYQFDSKDCNSEEELARAMALNWKRAIEEVTRGRLGENYKTKLGMEYKSSSDRIGNIEYDYENISPDVSKHAVLAEIVAFLGKNMAFAWKGRIYEDENGNTDYRAIAVELYKDAENAEGNEFDELVSSRALKELLYPQIRFVDESSSEDDKQNVDYYGCIQNIEYINGMAKESMKLAKYYLAEVCYKNAESASMDSYIIDAYTNGKTKNLNDFIKDTFSSANIDQAMKIVNLNSGESDSKVLDFLDEYKKSDRLKASILNIFNLDYKILSEIKMTGSKTEQILELIILLAFCDEVSNGSIGIKDIFMQTCYVKVICGYIQEKSNWEFIDATGNTKAKEYKKRLDHSVDVLEELSNFDSYKVFCEFVRNLFNLQDLIGDVTKIFVYDNDIVSSGMLLCTQKGGSNTFFNSAITAKNEKSNLCLVNDEFLIPQRVAEKHCKDKGKITRSTAQKEVLAYSVEATHEYVKRFRNSFRSQVGDGIDGMLKQSKQKLIIDFVIALLVVALGVGLILSGAMFVKSKVFEDGNVNKVVAALVMIIDFVFGCSLLFGCKGDFKDTCNNLKHYKKNQELIRSIKLIDALTIKLSNATQNQRLVLLDAEEKEIVKISGSTGNSAKMYIEKHHLSSKVLSYKMSRSFTLFFAGVIGLMLLVFSHIPAKNVLGAMFDNNIELAEVFSESRQSLPYVIRSIDKKVTNGVLFVTESNAKIGLIDQYNSEEIDDKQFENRRKAYYSLCKQADYSIDKELMDILEKIETSKLEYAKGTKIRKTTMVTNETKEEIIKHYLNVIPEDSNYAEAQEFMAPSLTELYVKQQKYIEEGNAKALTKLAAKYKKLLVENVNGSRLKEMYNILDSADDIDQKAKKLVALQLYYKGDYWKDDGISRISCQGYEKGKCYVKTQKKTSGLTRLFHKYETSMYVFNTYTSDYVSDVSGDIKFKMQDFDSSINKKEYLAMLK